MASCTPGTDCYCDCARHTTGLYKNASCEAKGVAGDATALLMCEDFEAPTLRQNTGFGNGAPYYGPPYDATGLSGDRGHNGYWTQTYGNGVNDVLWSLNQPVSPALGATCGFSACTGALIWSVGDLWDANDYPAPMAFLASGEFEEEPNLVPPTLLGGGDGVFDGTASLFSRVPAGEVVGIFGTHNLGGTYRTFGITQATAYAPNVVTSSLMDANWKHNEWGTPTSGGGGDGIYLFGEAGWGSHSPFYQFSFSGGASQATCNTRLAAATQTLGDFECDGAGNFLWRAAAAQYDQETDWPLGTWGCVRGYYQNMGTTNSTIEMWFTGPDGNEVKIIEITGMNLTGHWAGDGYDRFIWNNYANANQGDPGSGPSTETSGRYEDNIHIRNGSPVSCTQIGFGAGGGGGGSATPKGSMLGGLG